MWQKKNYSSVLQAQIKPNLGHSRLLEFHIVFLGEWFLTFLDCLTPEVEWTTILQNVWVHLFIDTPTHSRRHKSSVPLLWEGQFLQNVVIFNILSSAGHSCVCANRTTPLHSSLRRRMATSRYSCSYCHKEPFQTAGVQMAPLLCGSQHKWDMITWWDSCSRLVPVLMLHAM